MSSFIKKYCYCVKLFLASKRRSDWVASVYLCSRILPGGGDPGLPFDTFQLKNYIENGDPSDNNKIKERPLGIFFTFKSTLKYSCF